MSQVLQGISQFIRSYKWMFVVAMVSAMAIFAFRFPFGDLSDFVTSKVSEVTQNNVYLQFETLDIGILPAPAVSGYGVHLEAASLPPIQAKWLKFAPSWLDVIANIGTLLRATRGNPDAGQQLMGKIGLTVSAEGLMGADVDLNIKPAGKNEQGAQRSKIYLEVEQLNLSELPAVFNFPIQLNGKADITSEIQAYPNFEEQPDGEVELKAKSLQIPASTVSTPLGPLALPALSFSEVVFKGKLINGNIQIEEANLGRTTDPLYGRVKGQLGLRFSKVGPEISPILGAFDLKIALELNPAAEKDFSQILGLLSGYRTTIPKGTRYLMQVKAPRMGMAPEITQLSVF